LSAGEHHTSVSLRRRGGGGLERARRSRRAAGGGRTTGHHHRGPGTAVRFAAHRPLAVRWRGLLRTEVDGCRAGSKSGPELSHVSLYDRNSEPTPGASWYCMCSDIAGRNSSAVRGGTMSYAAHSAERLAPPVLVAAAGLH